jgi:16S rRNA (uracil1498-N3)-methyltransferase
MSLPRFFIPPDQWNPGDLSLTGDEARHCTQVMRRGVGSEVVAFSGAGTWSVCRITEASKQQVRLSCGAVEATPEPMVSLALMQAIPKAGNMELIIEKGVELGVNAIYPVFTERTVVKLDSKESAKKRDKWQRLALEACKQCGQNWLPEIHLPQPLDSAWSTLPRQDLRLVAAIQQDAKSLKAILDASQASQTSRPKSALVLIGPEGDLTAEEYALARKQGSLPVSLGPIILRVETAALYCLSVLAHELR